VVPRMASDEELLVGVLHLRMERWLEQEGVLDIPGFGDVELAGELDWESGAGPVYLRRLDDRQVWRADITITARPAGPRGRRRPRCSASRTARPSSAGSWTHASGASTRCRPSSAPWRPGTRRHSQPWTGSE